MFSINTNTAIDKWEVWQLEDSRHNIKVDLVPGAGAIINAWWVSNQNIIDGYLDRQDFDRRVLQGFRSAKLSPFVCRLHQAGYTWRGVSYRLDKFMLNGSALHGILYDLPFDVAGTHTAADHCQVSMRYDYDGAHRGYPFPFRCEVTYTLRENGLLQISTLLKSPGSASMPMPITDGWHPYFRLGGKADQWRLQIASDQMMEYDDQLIPTGRYLFQDDFVNATTIGDRQLDNGFLLAKDVSPFCTLRHPENGLTVQFLQQQNYPFLQLYIPDSRETIAIENLSGAPDAFNNGIGLTVLEPGEEKRFSVDIRAGFTP